MPAGLFEVIIQLALLIMKIVGVSAQKRKNLLEWANKRMENSNKSIAKKDRWKILYKDLSDKIDKKNNG